MIVTIRWEVEQCGIEVEGNVMASGDDAADRECEQEIYDRLNQGDVWAWASVTCRATCEVDGQTFEGSDSLGGCCYRDAADFTEPGGYADDMRDAARAELLTDMRDSVTRGEVAARALKDTTVELEECGF